MADLTQVYAALQKADAAGDTVGAKQLADYIRTQSASTSTATAAPAQENPEGSSLAEFGKNLASAAVRPIVKAVAGIPMMAADAGVAARNLVTNLAHGVTPTLADFNPFAKTGGTPQPYELPSTGFNQALDTYTRPPEGLLGKGAELASTMLLGSRVPAPQGMGTVRGAIGSTLGGASEDAGLAPTGFVNARQDTRNTVLQRAQNEGYVVPPASNNPTFGNRLMEGISGKLKLQQEAAARNQPVTDMLAARALGQNPDMPLTQGALSTIRGEAAASGYAPLRQLESSPEMLAANAKNSATGAPLARVGDIPTDNKFLSDLQDLTKISRGASNSFPGLHPAGPIDGVVQSLSQPKFNMSDGLDAMAALRGRADDAFRSGNGTLGTQYKGAARAVEDMIERHLSSREDGAGLLDAFRAARQKIAQTYTAGKAVVGDTGSSNALKYAAELAKGKPLVGDQRTIASFASQFRKAAAFQTESMPSISPLDAYGSAISAAASHSALPLGLPLTRVALREYLLSQAGQARAIAPQIMPRKTLGLLSAFPTAATSGLLSP